jgi:biopolymer transport protein ExbD
MKVSRKRKGGAEIPTASTSDIAFLLIIFFMATTKFDVKEGLTLVLPPAAKEDSEQIKLTPDQLTKVFITATGDIVINEKDNLGTFNQSAFDDIVKEKLNLNPEMIFSIKTDREAKYNDMIRVLDRLKTAGAEKISLSTN